MNTFHENQTQAQVNAAITAGGFTKITFSVVGPDTRYPNGSVTVVLQDASSDFTGYRTAVASIAAGKTYVASLVSAHSITTAFNFATVDDGNGILYTLAQVQAW